MTEQQSDIVVIVVGLPLFIVSMYLWFKVVKCMTDTLANVKPEESKNPIRAIFIFMPGYLTDLGNAHRADMLKYLRHFLLSIALPFILVGFFALIFRVL